MPLFRLTSDEDVAPKPLRLAGNSFALRDYQQAAVDAVHEAWQRINAALIVLPTGCGKTMCFADIIKNRPGRCLVLAHRSELIHQAAEKIKHVTGETCAIEMADYWSDENYHQKPRIVVSSIQTQIAGKNGGRMTRFDPGEFNTVIVDECHHVVADTYKKVLSHYQQNPNCKILGVTATPDRTDEEALGQVFEEAVYVYEILDAIKEGYLSPIKQQTVQVESLDFSQTRTTAGDLNGGDLEKVMVSEKALHGLAYPILDITKGRKTLVFTASVAHAEKLAEIFNRYQPDCARWLCGKTPKDERREILREYHHGKYQILCNVDVLTEGFDEPTIECVALGRPTESRAKCAQMIGRGTRVLPGVIDGLATADARVAAIEASAKTSLLVLDFVGNAGKHKLISTADVLGGNYSDDVVARAKQICEDDPDKEAKPSDVAETLEQAEEQIEREKQEAKRKAKRANVKARANYKTATVDPFEVLDIEPRRERGWETGKSITDRQAEAIDKFTHKKIKTSELSQAAAAQLLDKLVGRAKHGYCTYSQAKLLKAYGYDVKAMKFEQARDHITAIKANGWKRPSEQPASVPVKSEVVF